MDIFYEPNLPEQGSFFLSKEESHHCIKVLRNKIHESIFVIDGKGRRAQCKIESDSDKNCQVLIEKLEFKSPKTYSIHIALAPTKNIERTEFFLEKAVEMGIDSITMMICKNSERTVVKQERLEKIVLSAVKQSQAFYIPTLHPQVSFKQCIQQLKADQKYIAVCNESAPLFSKQVKPNASLAFLIGPEGDFTSEEIELAIENDFKPLSLGVQRMRVETAALTCCSWSNFINLMG